MSRDVRYGQVYASCDPRGGPRIRVVQVERIGQRLSARVVDATTGKRPRWVLVEHLHPTGTTTSGRPRRTGYRLVSES